MTRPNLLGLTRQRLGETLQPYVDQRYRIDQIYQALYQHRLRNFDEMTALGKGLRQELTRHFTLARPEIASQHESTDGTVKILFRLEDGATIETVDIPDGDRRTLCLSSQAGCALACSFCVTGFWGAGRDLTAGEIVAQVLSTTERERPETHGLNLVFMGMGEPLLNLSNLADALEILFEQISWRRVTVSTVGIIPAIKEMATWPRRPQLAISLHAPDDARRSELMPINKRYPLADLLATLERYPLVGKQRITFEYLLIRDFNDALEDAEMLVRLLRRQQAKVNLIPLNEDPVLGDLRSPDPRQVTAFQRRLTDRGVLTTVRKRRGDDVSAACGQLRAFGRDPRGFRRSRLSL